MTKQEGSQSAHNTLRVEARADSVLFQVNGHTVHAMTRAGAPVDGIAGARINHGLSVHVASLDVRRSGR